MIDYEILLICVLTGAACAIPGVFLLLFRMSMAADSISHTILPGIVLGYLMAGDLSSPLLYAGAAFSGVVSVWLIELLYRTGLVREDSAAGLIAPFLFAAALILIARCSDSVHLDTDSVLLGEPAYAPFDRLIVNGTDIGAKGVWRSVFLLAMNLLLILLFYKELTLAAFDPVLAALTGFLPGLFRYVLITAASVTAVGVFETCGSVLTVALLTGPAGSAFLLTRRLSRLLPLAALFGITAGLAGYLCAVCLSVSIAGSMAVMTGILFLGAYLISRTA